MDDATIAKLAGECRALDFTDEDYDDSVKCAVAETIRAVVEIAVSESERDSGAEIARLRAENERLRKPLDDERVSEIVQAVMGDSWRMLQSFEVHGFAAAVLAEARKGTP
jgi:hypothetical protein